MRIGLLASALVHGAALAGLALFGVVRGRVEPDRPFAVSIHADTTGEIEPTPDDPAPPDAPPAPERWEFPEEAPAVEPIDAPPETPVLDVPVPARAVRLLKPLPRPARARATTALPQPAKERARVARSGDVRAPRLLEELSPAVRYPSRARRMGLEGTVLLLLGVGADGAVTRVEIESSSGHEELDRAAADAAKLWRFEPARDDGKPVAYDVRAPVEFRLTDA